MKKYEIYNLTIKIFGLFVLLKAVDVIAMLFQGIVFLVTEASDGMSWTIFLGTLFHFLLVTAIGVLMVSRSASLIRFMGIDDEGDEQINLFTDKKGVLELAFTIAGLVLLMWAIPDLINNLKTVINYRYLDPIERNFSNTQFLVLAASRTVLGALAIIYRSRLAQWVIQEEA